ncbi:gamma-glutamylcyclotransferase [Noviherbaspirillum denitrificans]|uniref:glutathione-specific gamma-glutamylcyclotransferase n=1 Tax=Noviherbaspirillum denitrificans TaxID=1968433 RepID=A0A254TDP8_9BURK|nr:gamma-glutamylcyclotransferase [Noviherbaspirillum denitrificans]OWW19432.1 hypothetical protein AYR66_07830 [Noviherbaspirillum denitrificans]
MQSGSKDAWAITREALSEESAVEAFRSAAPPGTRLLAESDLQASLDRALQSHAPGEDVHVFGYGSLMWNPAFHYAESFRATVWGWSRKFCLSLNMARGSPERPGVMLALDRGGACSGVVFRIPHHMARNELMLLWRREMLTGAYHARWLAVRSGSSRLHALTFVANRQHRRYLAALDDDRIAQLISNGAGKLGTCQAYFDTLVSSLEQLGIRDSGMERLKLAIALQVPNGRNGRTG